jgi:hypothetical protein
MKEYIDLHKDSHATYMCLLIKQFGQSTERFYIVSWQYSPTCKLNCKEDLQKWHHTYIYHKKLTLLSIYAHSLCGFRVAKQLQ